MPPNKNNGDTSKAQMLQERLAHHLQSHKERIVAAWKARAECGWNAQQAMNSLRGGCGASRMPSSASFSVEKPGGVLFKLVNEFYDDFMDVLQGAGPDEILRKHHDFPHQTPGGVHLSLPYYLEAIFAGEEVLADCLLAKRFGTVPFPDAEAARCFEEVNRVFRLLTECLAGGFCHDCSLPLLNRRHEVADLEKGLLQRNLHE